MRVINKIMQNNTLYNINQNKVAQDKLQTQINTEKKITKPSDDPVVAIRALRLRSNLSQVSQYYERNIPDAGQWMELTETSIETTIDVISGMIDQCRTGAKSSLTSSDRSTILESLKQLREEVYSTGDSDYAGRTIFTGYRTDSKLSFQKSETVNYSITEQFTNSVIDTITHVDLSDIKNVNETTYDTNATVEQDIDTYKVNRIRLSYGNLVDDASKINFVQTTYDANGDFAGTPISMNVQTVTAGIDPYKAASDATYASSVGLDADGVFFIPETGELLLGKGAYDTLMNFTADEEFTITYDKEEWKAGDLRPEHYFRCENTDDSIIYNESYLSKEGRNNKQVISYDVGFNQSIDVNTTADELYDPGIARAVDELVNMLSDLEAVDTVIEKLKRMKGDSSYNQDDVQARLDAANKSRDLLKDTLQKKFEHGITEFQGYLNQADEALTRVGNRSLRLELIDNRLSAQKLSFQELTSVNEDADIAEVAVKLKSAQLTYDASLAATGKMLSTTLLNYL